MGKGQVGGVPARVVLGVLSFFMFLVTQMIRANLYIAVVSMTLPVNATRTTQPTRALSWGDHNTAWLLGSFYFCYWMTELPGGLLAQKYGGRRVLGISVAVAGTLSLLFPGACLVHYWLAVLVRALQGLALGVTWPAMHSLSAHWIPSTERSKFMVSYHGAAIGSAIAYPLSGLLMTALGWDYVFYVTGWLTLAWSAAWWGLVFDSPAEHPRIADEEKLFLEESIGKTVAARKGLKTPWRAILTSAPFWATLIASQGIMWGSITLSMQLPAYFNSVHGLDYKTNGLVLGLPELCKFIFGLSFSSLVDWLLRNGVLSLTAARKISVAINEYVPAVLLVLLGYLARDNTVLAVTLLAVATAAAGASSSGNLANIVDLSPNFAGTLLGLIKTSAVIPGVISPLITNMLIKDEDPGNGWQHVFVVISVVHLVCCSIFLVMGSGEVQSWNKPRVLSPKLDVEQEEEKEDMLDPEHKALKE